MHAKSKNIQLRYQGFLKTPLLWLAKGVFDLEQFQYKATQETAFNATIDEKLRLGKYIERFVSFEFAQQKSIEILSENIQIQQDKITLGEIDCLLLKNNLPVHIEVIYKFYLYDSTVGTTEISRCIGPNRKDSLLEKLHKLTKKQLPLLYSEECKKYLKSLSLEVSNIQQQVYFKAQVFVPLANRQIDFSPLNHNCIAGFYMHLNELPQFKGAKFYIPTKKDWLIIPHTNVNWLGFNEFQFSVNEYLAREFSPMCWLKKANGVLEKFFLVWW